jgi:DNA-binding transcriptional LysR family regulator
VELTSAGRRFLGYAERSLAVLEEGRTAARDEHERLRLRLAAPSSFAEALFPGLAAALAARGVELWLSTDHSPQVIEALLDGRIEAGISIEKTSVPGLASVELTPVPIVCVARAGHPLTRVAAPSLAQLLEHELAIFEWGEDVSDLRERLAFAGERRPVLAYAKVSPAEVARRLVLEHQAVSFLPEPLIAADLEEGRLVRLEPKGLPAYHWRPVLVHRRRKQLDPALAELLEVLRPQARQAHRGRPSPARAARLRARAREGRRSRSVLRLCRAQLDRPRRLRGATTAAA